MMKQIFTLCSCILISSLNAQSGKVGVNTSTPTEILDISGTARVRELPEKDAANAIYTTGTNTSSTTKTSTFTPTKTVVADNNGVLGVVNGLPSGTGVGGGTNGPTFDWAPYSKWLDGTGRAGANGNMTNANIVRTGCIEIAVDPYEVDTLPPFGVYANKSSLYFRLANDSSCGTSQPYQAYITGGQQGSGTVAFYQNSNAGGIFSGLTTTAWTRMNGASDDPWISDDPIRLGEISLPGLNHTYKFSYSTRLLGTGGTGNYTIGAMVQRIY